MRRRPHPTKRYERKPENDSTLRYMDRFKCIGSDCEDNCCYGWRVEIDPLTYKRMVAVTSLDSREERLYWISNIVKKREPHKPVHYSLKMLQNENCPMLMENGWCHVQFKYGEKLLSDVCATYPRRIQIVGDHIELTGMSSCPEMTRQLILHPDATDIVPMDAATKLPRPTVSGGMDPRDVRPYWRALHEVRSFMVEVLKNKQFSLEKRLFFVNFFAKRTMPILNKKAMKGDLEKVAAEIAMMRDPKVQAEMERRLDEVETPSTLVLILARELVRRSNSGRTRDTYKEMVSRVYASYERLRPLIPDGQADAHITHEQVWDEFKRRKAYVLSRAGERIDQFFTNFAVNFVMHRLPIEAPDLQILILRLVTQMACLKFLMFSHPLLLDTSLDDAAFLSAVDKAGAEVFYKLARYMEHSPLLYNLEKSLERAQLKSVAGAVYLLRF